VINDGIRRIFEQKMKEIKISYFEKMNINGKNNIFVV